MQSNHQANAEQTSSKCRANIKQMQSKHQANAEQTSSKCRANIKQMQSKHQANAKQNLTATFQLWASRVPLPCKRCAPDFQYEGIIASVWIPMVPAVIWIGAVASLMAVWVEAVVAAPLWAFAHLDTDGEGMGQRTQTGYLFILNVLFRPALMVVGFLLGSMMVWILTTYVMNLFPTIIANASADSWTGMIKIVGYLAAFVIILQTIVSLSFGMIRFVPDQVLGWLGGNMVNSIGADTVDTVGNASRSAMAGRASVSGAASQASQAKKQREGAAQQEGAQKSAANEQTLAGIRHEDMMRTLGGGGQATVKGPGASGEVKGF